MAINTGPSNFGGGGYGAPRQSMGTPHASGGMNPNQNPLSQKRRVGAGVASGLSNYFGGGGGNTGVVGPRPNPYGSLATALAGRFGGQRPIHAGPAAMGPPAMAPMAPPSMGRPSPGMPPPPSAGLGMGPSMAPGMGNIGRTGQPIGGPPPPPAGMMPPSPTMMPPAPIDPSMGGGGPSFGGPPPPSGGPAFGGPPQAIPGGGLWSAYNNIAGQQGVPNRQLFY